MIRPPNFFKWITIFCLTITLGIAMVVDQAEIDELEIIEKSREIIKRIEDCTLNEPYASNATTDLKKHDDNDPIIELKDVKCGKTKFIDITRSIANNVKDEALPQTAMVIAYNALMEFDTFADIAAKIEKEIHKLQTKQQWLTIVNNEAKPVEGSEFENRALSRRFKEYIDFSIAHIRIKIFNLGPIKTSEPETTTTAAPKNLSLSENHSINTNDIKKLIEATGQNLNLDLQQNLIHISAALGLLPFVKFLIDEKKVDPYSRNAAGETPACWAARNNSIEILKFLIEEKKYDAHDRDFQGNSLLHCAAEGNASFFVLRYLVYARHIDPNSRNNMGETPLQKACESGTMLTIRFLVESAKGDLKAKNSHSQTALELAALANRLDVVKYLISKGPFNLTTTINKALKDDDLTLLKYIVETKNITLHYKFRDEQSFLHLAVRHKRFDFVKYLLEKDFSLINATDDAGTKVIQYAAYYGDMDSLKYLILKGQNLNYKNVNGGNTLHYAIMGKQAEIMKYLIEVHEMSFNVGNMYDYKPIHFAANYGCLECLVFLVEERDVDVNSRTRYNYTALSEAAKNRRLDIVIYLLDRGADPNIVDYQGNSILHEAEKVKNNGEVVERLKLALKSFSGRKLKADFNLVSYFHRILENNDMDGFRDIFDKQNISLNHKFENDKTFLHFAADYSRMAFVKYLVEKGLSPNAKDAQGITPMHYASKRSLPMLKYLESKGGDLSVSDENEEGLLHFAQSGLRVDVMKWLVEEKNMDPNKGNMYEYKPIHYSAFYNCLRCAKYLISKGVDVNSKSHYKYTPLREAVKYQRYELMRYFVEIGADIGIKDYQGKTALQLAEEKGYTEFAKFLKKAVQS